MRRSAGLFLLPLVAACGGSGVVEITDAWAGTTPPNADTAAVYLTIENGTNAPALITSVVANRCTTTEIHETRVDDQQVMRMRPATEEALTIGAGETLTMRPGAMHIMCIGVTEEFRTGDRFDLQVGLDGESVIMAVVEIANR